MYSQDILINVIWNAVPNYNNLKKLGFYCM